MSSSKSNSESNEAKRFEIQLSVLNYMSKNSNRDSSKYFPIQEIAEGVGSDEKDIQRSLFVLEGHKLVCPMPPGDFTSRMWCMTEAGMSAMKNLNTNNMALL
jgi:hypothetical protein